MIESVGAQKWIVGLLLSDATLEPLVGERVYDGAVPQGGSFPCVVVQYQQGHDTLGTGTTRIMSHMSFLVKAVGLGQSFVAIEPIADRIDQVLHGAHGEIAGASGAGVEILSCVRDTVVQYAAAPEGRHERHLGGLYDVSVTNRGPLPPEEPPEEPPVEP